MRLLLLLCLALCGCLTHIQPAHHEHLQLGWTTDYAQGLARAQLEHKPVLLVLAAGALDGPC